MIAFSVELSRWITAEALEDLDPLLAPSVRAGTETGAAWHVSVMNEAVARLRRYDSELAAVIESRTEIVPDEISDVASSYMLAEVYERCGKPAVAAAHRASLAQSGKEVTLLALMRMGDALAKLLACTTEMVEQLSVPLAWAALFDRWIYADAIEPFRRELARGLYFGDPSVAAWFCVVCRRALDAARVADPELAMALAKTGAHLNLDATGHEQIVHYMIAELRGELGIDSLSVDVRSSCARVLDRLRYTLAAVALEPEGDRAEVSR